MRRRILITIATGIQWELEGLVRPVAERATYDNPMNKSARKMVQKRRLLPAKTIPVRAKFAESSAREGNHKLQVARKNISRAKPPNRGCEANGRRAGGNGDSSVMDRS